MVSSTQLDQLNQLNKILLDKLSEFIYTHEELLDTEDWGEKHKMLTEIHDKIHPIVTSNDELFPEDKVPMKAMFRRLNALLFEEKISEITSAHKSATFAKDMTYYDMLHKVSIEKNDQKKAIYAEAIKQTENAILLHLLKLLELDNDEIHLHATIENVLRAKKAIKNEADYKQVKKVQKRGYGFVRGVIVGGLLLIALGKILPVDAVHKILKETKKPVPAMVRQNTIASQQGNDQQATPQVTQRKVNPSAMPDWAKKQGLSKFNLDKMDYEFGMNFVDSLRKLRKQLTASFEVKDITPKGYRLPSGSILTHNVTVKTPRGTAFVDTYVTPDGKIVFIIVDSELQQPKKVWEVSERKGEQELSPEDLSLQEFTESFVKNQFAQSKPEWVDAISDDAETNTTELLLKIQQMYPQANVWLATEAEMKTKAQEKLDEVHQHRTTLTLQKLADGRWSIDVKKTGWLGADPTHRIIIESKKAQENDAQVQTPEHPFNEPNQAVNEQKEEEGSLQEFTESFVKNQFAQSKPEWVDAISDDAETNTTELLLKIQQMYPQANVWLATEAEMKTKAQEKLDEVHQHRTTLTLQKLADGRWSIDVKKTGWLSADLTHRIIIESKKAQENNAQAEEAATTPATAAENRTSALIKNTIRDNADSWTQQIRSRQIFDEAKASKLIQEKLMQYFTDIYGENITITVLGSKEYSPSAESIETIGIEGAGHVYVEKIGPNTWQLSFNYATQEGNPNTYIKIEIKPDAAVTEAQANETEYQQRGRDRDIRL